MGKGEKNKEEKIEERVREMKRWRKMEGKKIEKGT